MASKSLIELRSDLRDIKYSETGTRTPYITKSIPEYEQSGGFITQGGARLDDLSRFSKLLTSQPGLKFVSNQTLLKQEETRREFRKARDNGKSLVGSVLRSIGGSLLGTVKTTASLLAQVPVNGTGTHFILGFGGRQYLQQGGSPQTGLGRFLRNTLQIGGGINGNQKSLNGQIIILDYDPKGEILSNGQESLLVDRPSALDIRQDFGRRTDNTGEPAPSLFGQNKFDEIKNGAKAELRGQRDENLNNGLSKLVESDGKITRSRTISNPNINPNAASDIKLTDIALTAQEESSIPNKILESAPDNKFKILNYAEANDSIILKYNPGKRSKDLSNKLVSQEVDEINVQGITEKLVDEEKDIIPFRFNIFTPLKPKGQNLYFRAFLKGLNDNYSGDWSGNKYIGRAEEFFTYQGFKRDISFEFTIAAFSREELMPLYKKINSLVSSTAPVYRGNGAFMQGTLVNLTIGDYIKQLNGFISSVQLTWDLSYPWEIDYEKEQDVAKVPHVLNASISFTPIHDFNVKSNINYKTQAYIAPGNWYAE